MTSNTDMIALVDENDNVTGYADKLEVHRKGLLHRAFSIVVQNDKKEIMLQRRALGKYHSAGLWTNTCCSHMLMDDDFENTIHTRLKFEMGFDCELTHAFNFQYRVAFENSLIENEIDHVYIGIFNGTAQPNPDEVCEWRWMNREALQHDIRQNAHNYTYWFKLLLENMQNKQ